MFAILAAGWSFLPRDVPILDIERLSRYVHADVGMTKIHILDAEVVMTASMENLIRNKARRLIIAFGHLAAAVALIGGGKLKP